MNNKVFYIQIDNGSINDYKVQLKSFTKGKGFDELEKFKYVSKDNLKTVIKEFSKGKNIDQIIDYTENAKIIEPLTRMERQELIQKIYKILRNDDNFKHSLGLAWLEKMTDQELKDKLKEVSTNEC